MKPTHRLLPLCLLVLVAATSPAAGAETSYGYVRSLEGSATLDTAERGNEALEINQPLLGGDRVIVGPRSRVELALADYNLVRIDEGSELVLEQLAFSADRSDRVTVLRLERGELQVVVHDQALGDQLPRIDTPNATVHLLAPGTYRIAAVDPDWSEVVVRTGEAEVLTPGSSARLAGGEAVEVEGERVYRAAATADDGLEHWARRLDSEAVAADTAYVEPELRYAAAPLARHGAWVSVSGRRGWRPHAAAGWRPYTDGRWAYTPSGLTWIDYQPWGWVTSHYGCWDYAPGFGWTWFPGHAYSPAWVYWYWGPSYTGWCPVGYYTRYYGYHDNWWYRDRFHRGTYGWAGGGWQGFDKWTFCDSRRLGDRHLRRHAVPGHDLRDRGILATVPRGIVTTDTRGLTPDRWGRPDAVEAVLRTRRDARPGAGGGQLPDVSDFVARRRDLTPEVQERVLGGRPRTAVRVDSRPMMPGAIEPRNDAPRAGEAGGDSGRRRIAVPRVEGERRAPASPPTTQGRTHLATPRVVPANPGVTAPAPRTSRPRVGSPAPPAAGDAWRESDRRRVAVPRVAGERPPQTAPAPPQRRTHLAAPRVVPPAPTASGPRAVRPRVQSPTAAADAPRPRAYAPPPGRQGNPPVVRRVVDGIRRDAPPPRAYAAPRPAPRPSAPPPGYGAPPPSGRRPVARPSASPPPPRATPQARPQSQPRSDSGSDGGKDDGAARSRRPRSKDGG